MVSWGMTFRYLLPSYMLFAHKTKITKPRRPGGVRNEVTARDGMGILAFPTSPVCDESPLGGSPSPWTQPV